MGLNESLQTSNVQTKAFDDLYITSYQALCLTYQLQEKPDPILFTELMAIYSPFKNKYRWAQRIPMMMQKYFFSILPSLRKCQLEGFYRALNLTVFSDNKQTTKDYEGSFFRRVTNSELRPSRQIGKLLDESILFEDDVINKHANKEKMEVSNIFRESIICPKLQSKETHMVVLSNAVFVENLSKKDQQEIAFSVELYKRFAMVLESIINSAAYASIPLRHFELQMTQNKARKKIKSFASTNSKVSMPQSSSSSSSFSFQFDKRNVPNILKQTQEGIQKRKIVMHNQKLLLQMIESFIQTFTDFIWGFYNLSKLEDLESARLIDCENIYNLLTDTVWLRVSWVGERGWEYEQLKTQLYLKKKGVPQHSEPVPQTVINLAMNLPNAPLKHLKQIAKIYRIIAGLSRQMTADGLMLYYRRLFYELSLRNKFVTLYRMVNIVNKLWKGQKFGEVGYAWTTWEAGIQIALKEAETLSLENLLTEGTRSTIQPMQISS